MSHSEILYVKDMNVSESEGDDADQDIWDDRKINDAYDKAMKVANAEVAKRLAMATNSKNQNASKEGTQQNKPKYQNRNKQSPRPNCPKQPPGKSESQWKVGTPCRAIYTEDGLEYEALVARVISDKECVVQFIGYDNLEIKQTSTLKPSQGKDARAIQIEMAVTETGGSLTSSPRDAMDCESERVHSPGSTERSFPRKKKSPKRKNNNNTNKNMPPMSQFGLPDLPMPNMNMFRNINMSSMEMPMPPPLSMAANSIDSEEQAVSSMLLSWYMSGYYTGLYQGLKRAKENRRNN